MKNRPSTALYFAFLVIIAASAKMAFMLYSGPWAKIMAIGLGTFTALLLITLIINYIQRSLYAQAEQEKEAETKLKKNNQKQLFSEISQSEAQKRYQMMSRYGEIGVTFLLLLVSISGFYALYFLLPEKDFSQTDVVGLLPLASYANLLIVGTVSFALFIIARIIQLNPQNLIRPLGHYLSLFSIYTLICIGFIILSKLAIASNWNFKNVDTPLIIVSSILLLLLIIQYVINIIRKLYAQNSDSFCCYDHQIMSLFSSHKSFFNSMTEFSQFQFGITLSAETIEKLLWKKITLFIGLLVLILFLLSTISIVPLNQVAFIETLGKLKQSPLSTGIHFHAPYPFSKIYLIDNQRIRTLSIGRNSIQDIKWSNKDFFEKMEAFGKGKIVYNLKTKTEELASITIDIRYEITDAYCYLFTQKEPEYSLRQLIESQLLSSLFTGQYTFDYFGENQLFNEMLKNNLNQNLFENKMGISILQISFSQFMPAPDKNMHEAFNNEKDAFIKGETTLVKQEKTILEQNSQVVEKSESVLANAMNYKYDRLKKVETSRIKYAFDEKMYQKYGQLYTEYLEIESQRSLLPALRKFVFFVKDEAKRKRLIELDYRGELGPSLLDAKINPKKTTR